MHTLYGNFISGNCWKPAFMLRQRGWPFRWVEVDILKRESRTPEFLAMNPNGRVPLLQLPDGRRLAESNAMLLHLGEGSAWLPADAYARAKVYEWLFFEQYSHEPFVATVRFWVRTRAFGDDSMSSPAGPNARPRMAGPGVPTGATAAPGMAMPAGAEKTDEWRDKIAEAMAKGYAALGVMELQLARTPFLVGETPTLADVALYAYTHVAHEGGYDLRDSPALRGWLARFAALPGFVPMPCTA